MPTKIGLVSDVHASPKPLKQALDIFAREQVSKIICAGDIAGYFDQLSETIDLLERHHCETITGNHDQSFLEDNPDAKNSPEYRFLQALPETLEYYIEGKSIYVVHAHPPSSQHGGIKLLDQNGLLIDQQRDYWTEALEDFDYDVLIVGHTHQAFAERLGSTFIVNPGSTPLNHSCMVLSLPDLSIEIFALEGQAIVKSWNFSYLFGEHTNYPSAKHSRS
ncbi:MAG: YfcE family phosphodiesterase [Gammaproteobacteria bacterium]|nr:YfcE family phosphodiesterase [Gammaproteobacteria bacterium]